jgi:hypothetical protein
MLVLAQTPGVSHALVAGCRADPSVTLSNGVSFELTTQIGTALASITHISYTLHLAPSVSVRSVSYPDGTAGISSFSTVTDDAVGNYDDDTVITSAVKVTATAYFVVESYPAGLAPTNGAPAQGSTSQDLHIHLHIAGS